MPVERPLLSPALADQIRGAYELWLNTQRTMRDGRIYNPNADNLFIVVLRDYRVLLDCVNVEFTQEGFDNLLGFWTELIRKQRELIDQIEHPRAPGA